MKVRNKACKRLFIVLLCIMLNGCIGLYESILLINQHEGNFYNPLANAKRDWYERTTTVSERCNKCHNKSL